MYSASRNTCKRLGVNPYEYLRDVIDRVSTHPASRIQELLPRAWQAGRSGHRGPDRLSAGHFAHLKASGQSSGAS